MQKLNILLLLSLICSIFFIQIAEAKRFGGGRSFGVQRSFSNYSRNANPSGFAQNAGQRSRSWLGPIAGFLAGGALASLFMSNGFGSGMLSWLAIGLVILVIARWIKQRNTGSSSSFYQNNFSSQTTNSNPFENKDYNYKNNVSSLSKNITSDNDNFLREAKSLFIRLQAAYDNKDLPDIRQFTAPEVFAEIQLQISERGSNELNVTQVISLDAALEDESYTDVGKIMTVRFTGLIKENYNHDVQFVEKWHFRQDQFSKNWLVIGIEQT